MKVDNSDKEFHEVLLSVVEQFGEEVIAQSQLRAILSDLTAGGQSSRFMSVIARAVSYGLGRRLLDMRGLDDADFNLRVMNLRHEFMEDNYLQADVSDYIVDSFIYSLGWGNVPSFDRKGGGVPVELPFGFMVSEQGDFIGNINGDCERQGLGIHGKEDGYIYAGQWKFNSKNGIGMELLSGKQRYTGDFRMNRRHGVGVMTFPDGSKYLGEWKNGKRHGWGTIFFPNGEKMYVQYANDEIATANGLYFLQDNSLIYGPMSALGPNGECIRICANGASGMENWINGVKQ